MSLTGVALMSHGTEALIHFLDPHHSLAFHDTCSHQIDVASKIAAKSPETLVVITPHGVRAEGMITISYAEWVEGHLDIHPSQPLHDTYAVNRPLAEHLIHSLGPVSTAAISYGASAGEFNRLPLDWGAHVPLRFIQTFLPSPPSVVILTPSRSLSLASLFSYDQHLASLLKQWPSPVALIASGDLSHTHNPSGPYGFDSGAASFDRDFVTILKTCQARWLLSLPADYINRVKVDALWQVAIMLGVLSRVTHGSWDISGYSCPTYFGMASGFVDVYDTQT
ncbi:MAG: hypothetical protein C7B47_12910 [Sulfobacillus thermosulfidooxidans]|uniref:Extradiol ring-cleavage dioxygenase class III enzyme subunit B domain-containing protein n=1 Tax=Sulfobacillus thermosulfidooxidans TaxID=28034 RepID=A0A2T2WSC4_SULTH|nr:MAG: hypothetical protein C7B47_12910 [Sulfobacillus thermosulfidooxidans]